MVPQRRPARVHRHRKKKSMGLDQIGITLSGVIAIWLTQDKRAAWRRWAEQPDGRFQHGVLFCRRWTYDFQ